jgi:hypothetical protein
MKTSNLAYLKYSYIHTQVFPVSKIQYVAAGGEQFREYCASEFYNVTYVEAVKLFRLLLAA